jgi:hypothetical protein
MEPARPSLLPRDRAERRRAHARRDWERDGQQDERTPRRVEAFVRVGGSSDQNGTSAPSDKREAERRDGDERGGASAAPPEGQGERREREHAEAGGVDRVGVFDIRRGEANQRAPRHVAVDSLRGERLAGDVVALDVANQFERGQKLDRGDQSPPAPPPPRLAPSRGRRRARRAIATPATASRAATPAPRSS